MSRVSLCDQAVMPIKLNTNQLDDQHRKPGTHQTQYQALAK
jgi:hypothetical protein